MSGLGCLKSVSPSLFRRYSSGCVFLGNTQTDRLCSLSWIRNEAFPSRLTPIPNR